jgi:Spy/CpxP family protein refolding chaperone
LQGQATAARDALKAAIKANSSDSELDRLSAAAGVIEGQLTGIQAKASAKFYALLTADQKTKYDALGNRGGGPGRNRFGRGSL